MGRPLRATLPTLLVPLFAAGLLARGTGTNGIRPRTIEGLEPRPAAVQVPDEVYGDLLPAVRALGVLRAHELGLTGAGVRIGVLAPAFRSDHVAFASRVVATRDFVDGDDDVSPPDSAPALADRGTAVASLAAGDWPGELRSPAFEADLLLARVGGGDVPVRADEERWIGALEWLVQEGADVIVSAVTFRTFQDFEYALDELDGDTPLATAAADAAALAGVLVVVPAGDGGPGQGTLASPADADSVLSVGASSTEGSTAELTGLGPTADGRPVPASLAPGVQLPAAGGRDAESRVTVTGTAFAAALLAGSGALFLEAELRAGPRDVIAALLESGVGRLDGVGSGAVAPVPHTGSALLFPRGFGAVPLDEVSPAGRVTSLTPTFRWSLPEVRTEAVPLELSLELATDSLFQDVLLEVAVSDGREHRFERPLPARTDFRWRVVATTRDGFRRSTPVLGPVTVPPWVELRVLNDPGGQTVADPRPEFAWDAFEVDPPAGPLQFDVDILSDRDEDLVLRVQGLNRRQFTPDLDLPFNVPLRWRVVARAVTEGADTATSAGPFVVTSRSRPPMTILFQNFPNPFPGGTGSTVTSIWFDLAERGPVTLTVHDLRGRLVRRLIPGRGCPPVELSPGQYGRDGGEGEDAPCVLLHWDARDDGGERVAPGVYLLRLGAGGSERVRRMVYWP